jgi:hypothetical protein
MLPTPQAQPYRAGSAHRMPGMVLEAMLAGRQPGQTNAADFERVRRQQATFQQLLAQRMQRPQATADVRGGFGGAVPTRRPDAPDAAGLLGGNPQLQMILQHLLATRGPSIVR